MRNIFVSTIDIGGQLTSFSWCASISFYPFATKKIKENHCLRTVRLRVILLVMRGLFLSATFPGRQLSTIFFAVSLIATSHLASSSRRGSTRPEWRRRAISKWYAPVGNASTLLEG